MCLHCAYNISVKRFTWNLGKNTKLKEERGVSFEEIQDAIFRGAGKVASNTSRNHPGQRVFLLNIRGKTWIVPFTETKTTVFLHTIYERGKP